MQEADGYTTIEFRRDFVTCDEYGEDMDIPVSATSYKEHIKFKYCLAIASLHAQSICCKYLL